MSSSTMTTPFVTSPLLEQPLPNIIDSVARQEPNRVFSVIAREVDSIDGARTVTWGDLARAVDRAASYLDSVLKPSENISPFSFLANNYDFRYIIFLIAGTKSSRKAFFPSPRNSEEFNLHLINKIGVTEIISSIPVGSYAEKAGCKVYEPPSLHDLLAEGHVERYPYNKTSEQAMNDEVCIFHSSGSTGPPKPISWNNAWLKSTRDLVIADVTGDGCFDLVWDSDNASMLAMPLFHTAGSLITLSGAVYMGRPMLFFPAAATLNTATVASFIEAFKPLGANLPPAIIEDVAHDEKSIESFKHVNYLLFGGAGLAKEAGEKLQKYTKVISMIGSTEASFYPIALPHDDSIAHEWMRFTPLPGFVFQKQDDGLFELVYERTPAFDWPIFRTFPTINEYGTKDLYVKHPTLPDTWKLTGRKDDVLVLSNGEKVVPPPMEDIIRMAPGVTGALYFGQGKSTVGLLVELNAATTKGLEREEIVKYIRPFALKANEIAPAFARLTKDMVIYTTEDKPMRRAPKGSIIRRSTIADYAQEIEDLYLNADVASAIPLVKDLSEQETRNSLTHIFEELFEKEVGEDDDFFSAVGADSMQVISATRTIKTSIQAEAPEHANKMTSAVIYANATIRQLAVVVRSLVLHGSTDAGRDSTIAVTEMISKYTEGIPEAVAYHNDGSDKVNVLLTGSTGSLGSYMLHLLIENSKIGKVFALNRSDNAAEKQQKASAWRGLSTDFAKVVFMVANFGNKNLGLSTGEYRELVNSVDLIIHNAWPVNFNRALESFEPHIRGVRNFIDLAAASPRQPQVEFISSIGTVATWDAYHPGTPRPERVFDDPRTSQVGYGESKYVGEHILAAAAAAGVSSTVARVGQVGGPVERAEGQWSKQEWLPSIILSSAHMGKLPTTIGFGDTAWIPVDSMAKIVTELGLGDLEARRNAVTSDVNNGDKATTTTYNLVNPHPTAWAALLDTIKARMPHVQEVDYSAWARQVRADADDSKTDATLHPATKLADFFESIEVPADAESPAVESAVFATDLARDHSKTMAGMKAVNSAWMDRWLIQWGF